LKVISPRYLPTYPPFTFTAVSWLMLDRYQPPGWVYGAVGCFVALGWLTAFASFVHEDYVHPADIKRPN
jgi:hypothetical protein